MNILNKLSARKATRSLMTLLVIVLTSSVLVACGGSSSGKSEDEEQPITRNNNIVAASSAVMNDQVLSSAILRGQRAYEASSNGCVLCHGNAGQGAVIPTPINNTNDCNSCNDLNTLALRISSTMPTDNTAKCAGGTQAQSCSHDVATYMWYTFLGNDVNQPPVVSEENNNGGQGEQPANNNNEEAAGEGEAGEENEEELVETVEQNPPPPVGSPAANDQQLFAQTVYPLLRNNTCVGCHFGGGIGKPDIAHPNVTIAYQQVVDNQKVNLNNPQNSRLVQRLRVDRHFCFGGVETCDADANTMQMAIEQWANQSVQAQSPVADARVTSGVTSFAQGLAGNAARVDDSVIALYTFSEGTGAVAHDSSGVGTAMDLTIEGMQWHPEGGLMNVNGKATASVSASRKLHDLIEAGNAYTIEAWVQPENTSQSGPARIVSYSKDTSVRNFTMGQQGNRYAFRNRSSATDDNGTPNLEAVTPAVSTELQHVVMTFDGASGRTIYVNGELGATENEPGNLANWDDGYQFVIGNELTSNRTWKGTFKMVAIHNRALGGAEVQQNFDAGNGTFTRLQFDVSSAVGSPAYIEMQATEVDAFSYVFTTPVMMTNAVAVPVRNIRIAVNNSLPVALQAFRHVDTFVMQNGQELSPYGAVIPKDLGVDQDQFHLEFELLGDQVGIAEVPAAAAPPAVGDAIDHPVAGVRTFSQINDTFSTLTGISPRTSAVRNHYEELRDQLPPSSNLLAFSGAQQVAIQRLAITYCGEITRSSTRCNNFFGACAVANANDKTRIADLLYDRFIGDGLQNQPAQAGVGGEINALFDDLGCANGCADDLARTSLQASCAAVLSSAALTIQ